jgi:DNA-binding CsgD family transcriptional regulator
MLFFIGLGLVIIQTNEKSSEIPGIELIYIYIILDFVFTSWGLLYLAISAPGKSMTFKAGFLRKFILISIMLLVSRISMVVLFYFYPISIPGFILFYFLSIVFPIVYIYYNITDLIISDDADNILSSYENILARYGITRREREIVEQVCKGKSNQEIADALFISLQTVKDHTHRIYLKMNIKSRVQLIKMMQVD